MCFSRCSLVTFLFTSLFCGLPMCSGQITLWDQQPDRTLQSVVDSEFAEPFSMFTTYLVNDASFSTGVEISTITVYFTNNSGEWPSTISEARLSIFTDDFTPFDPRIDGELVSVDVREVETGVLAISADKLDITLGAGRHWIGLTPVLDLSFGAQEFRLGSGNTVGETFARNPRGGFGLGTDWLPASVFAPGFGDAAMTISNDYVGGSLSFPNSATVTRGFEVSGEFEDVCFRNGGRWIFNPGFVLNSTEAPVWIEFDGLAPVLNKSIDYGVFVVSQASTPGLTLTVEEFNFATNAYELIGELDEAFNVDAEHFVPASGHRTDFATVRCRLGWRQTGFTLQFPWEVRIDALAWKLDTP